MRGCRGSINKLSEKHQPSETEVRFGSEASSKPLLPPRGIAGVRLTWSAMYAVFVLLCFHANELRAQAVDSLSGAYRAVDTTLVLSDILAHFDSARSLSIDPEGHYFVIDGQSIVKLSSEGKQLGRFGGGGSGRFQFDDPSDIDPTNGLEIYVADRGNARVQKFSREFRLLETLPLRLMDTLAEQIRGVHYHNADLVELVDGEPVSVAVNLAQDVYAVDEAQGVIVRWDASRSVVEVFGELDEPDGQLLEPVSVATDLDGRIYVADRGRQAVVVFDAFGNYLRLLKGEGMNDLNAVGVYSNRLVVTSSHSVAVYDTTGRRLLTYGFGSEKRLVDTAYYRGYLLVLTRDALYRCRL